MLAFLTLSVESFHFECSFTAHYPGSLGNVYTCFATVTASESPTLDSVTGDHQLPRDNDDVECLLISSQNVPSIPEGINLFFPNLIALLIGGSSLQSISAQDFQPFPQLLYLDLPHNQLVSLDGDLFEFNPLLQMLYLNGNNIRHIGHNLVENLEDLVELNLSGNECIDSNARNRDEVLELAAEFTALCPAEIQTTTDDI